MLGPRAFIVDDPFPKLVAETAEKVYGIRAVIYPTSELLVLHLF